VRSNVRYVPDGRFHRFAEVWQLPHETYSWRRGDCEDSAILLADWLRALGYDAVVAAGEAYGASHAWVVLHHEGQNYILETTGSKGSDRRMLPLAELMTDYRSPDEWYKLIPTD
jgi:transglutaminase-like putative cysteine protease